MSGFNQEQLSQLSNLLNPLYAKIDEQSVKINEQSVKIDALTDENKELTSKIGAQAFQIASLNKKVSEQNELILAQQKELERLRVQNAAMAQRLTSIEARLDLLDSTLTGMAPLFRQMLETREEDSLLLNPDWKCVRDDESVDLFVKTIEVAANQVELKSFVSNSNRNQLHSLAIRLGKSCAGFYKSVLSYAPRQLSGTCKYHKDEELVIVEHALKVAKSIVFA